MAQDMTPGPRAGEPERRRGRAGGRAGGLGGPRGSRRGARAAAWGSGTQAPRSARPRGDSAAIFVQTGSRAWSSRPLAELETEEAVSARRPLG